MKKIIFLLLAGSGLQGQAQNNLASNIIEGGKVVVDILKVFRSSKYPGLIPATTTRISPDSCEIKGTTDICYKNTSGQPVTVNLYKRNGEAYASTALSLIIEINSSECLYEIQAGIYKYKIEYKDKDKTVIQKEGEIKLVACDKRTEEIKK